MRLCSCVGLLSVDVRTANSTLIVMHGVANYMMNACPYQKCGFPYHCVSSYLTEKDKTVAEKRDDHNVSKSVMVIMSQIWCLFDIIRIVGPY